MGLGPHIKFGGKIWGKVRPSSPNKRKNLGSSVTTRRKSCLKSLNFGVISKIQRAKFEIFVIYIFGGKIWGSNKNFRGKIWGQAPRPPNIEAPPGVPPKACMIKIFRGEGVVDGEGGSSEGCLKCGGGGGSL